MINVKKYTLRDLKTKFENREFAIPEIQRQFVWNKPRICKLMDSIFREYPIGINLVWIAPYKEAIKIRPNNKTFFPPFDKFLKKAYLIIDGQQRLSSIFGVINGVEKQEEANQSINFKELFFDCKKESTNKFIFSKKLTQDSKGYIRLYDLLNNQPAVLRRKLHLTKWEAKEAEKCYSTFYKYSFYILEFEGMKQEDVKEIFIRINSAGMQVSRADTLFTRASRVALRDHMIDTRRDLRYGFNKISVDAMQNTLAMAYGAEKLGRKGLQVIINKIEKNKDSDKEFPKLWKKLNYGYREAVDFMVNHLNIKNINLLPSDNLYSLLSYFFYLTQSRAKLYQIREIKKWFWYTCCGERYSGLGFNRNIPVDIKFFRRLVQHENAKYTITEKIEPIPFLKSNFKDIRGSFINTAYLIMLRNKKPLYMINGEEMLLDDVSAISNRKDRHHIFPDALLKRKTINPKWINSICNMCFLEADENQSFSDNHPRLYLEPYKRKKHFHKVMNSHLIPYNYNSPVWETNVRKGFKNFINIRGKSIIKEIEKLAGKKIKIFEKFDNIKRI
jgi:hypothetical protein